MTYLKRLFVLLSFIGLITQYSCYSTAIAPSVTVTGDTRTLVLDGEFVSEKSARGFTCWYCKDYYDGGKTLVEVGIMGIPINGLDGFVLFDGGYSGKVIGYTRDGLDRAWLWQRNGTTYMISIKPDGTGYYYVTTDDIAKDASIKPRQTYKCYQRKN